MIWFISKLCRLSKVIFLLLLYYIYYSYTHTNIFFSNLFPFHLFYRHFFMMFCTLFLCTDINFLSIDSILSLLLYQHWTFPKYNLRQRRTRLTGPAYTATHTRPKSYKATHNILYFHNTCLKQKRKFLYIFSLPATFFMCFL